jgi:hypothetical protein
LTLGASGWYPVLALERPSGKINLIAVILILGVLSGVYVVVMFSRPWLDNLDVREHISAAYNQAGTLDDQHIKQLIETRTMMVGDHEEDDGAGNVRTAPGLGLGDENITVERDEDAKTISIHVDYARKVVLSPTSRVYWWRFHPEQSGPIIRH